VKAKGRKKQAKDRIQRVIELGPSVAAVGTQRNPTTAIV